MLPRGNRDSSALSAGGGTLAHAAHRGSGSNQSNVNKTPMGMKRTLPNRAVGKKKALAGNSFAFQPLDKNEAARPTWYVT